MLQIKEAVANFLRPPPTRQALVAKEQSDRVVAAAEEYGRHQDVLGDLVRGVRGERTAREKKAVKH